MARGNDDPADADDGRVLSPDELDITDDEHVAEIDDGRYVVSPNDPIDDVPTASDGAGTTAGSDPGAADADRTGPERPDAGTESPAAGAREPPAERPQITERDVHEWLEADFEDAGSRYGFDVTAKFDGSVHQRRMVSNDVVTIFESLVLWYAQGLDSSTPVEEVLGILLMEANVPVRYPPGSLQRVLESTDLSPDDTIADLMAAVGDEDGFRL